MAIKEDSFKVAGLYYYQEDFLKKLNFDIDNDDYEFDSSSVELIPEPENKHDPNAIKVLVNGIKIGYVPKESTSFARDIIDSPNYLGAKVTIFGERDEEDDNDNIDLWANIYLTSQFESEEEKKSEKNLTILAKIELIVGILLFIASLIITKASFIFFALLIITHSLYYLYREKNQ